MEIGPHDPARSTRARRPLGAIIPEPPRRVDENPVIAKVVDALRARTVGSRAEAEQMLLMLELQLPELTERERQAVVDHFDAQ